MKRADDALRRALLAPAGPWGLLLAALAAAAFALLLAGTSLLPPGNERGRLAEAALLCVPFAFAALFAWRVAARCGESHACLLLALLAALAGMLARVNFLRFASADYENYLASWIAELASCSFPEAMRRQVGEYNVLYQYLLFLAGRLPVPALTAVKLVSFAGDALLAAGMARLAGRRGLAGFTLALLLPTVLLNGAVFSQCDSLYTACLVWALALALERRGGLSAACFALALAFKLQALFLFPMLPVLWASGRMRLRDAFPFLGALALTALPALLGGKSPAAILATYAGQTGLYTGLTYEAPTLFGLLNTAGLDVYLYGRFGVLLALGAALAVCAAGVRSARDLPDAEVVRLCCLTAALVVFLLPRMHERYFYPACCLTAVMAVRLRRVLPAAVLAELACLSRLWDMGVSLRASALMMLAAIALLAMPERRREGGAA